MGSGGAEGTVFAGPRDDFYVDLGSIFDLANLRPKGPRRGSPATTATPSPSTFPSAR